MTMQPGRLLRPMRAGEHKLLDEDPRFRLVSADIVLTSPAFGDWCAIPQRHAGKGVGDDVSPPLAWEGVPAGAVELVLVMQDPDAPLPFPITHVIATGIDPDTHGLAEGALDPVRRDAIAFGRGTLGQHGYLGPRPPAGHGQHRYVFQLYALSVRLEFRRAPGVSRLARAMDGHVLSRGRLTGLYEQG